MPPRIVPPSICPFCAHHLSKSRRHISTVSSQSQSKVHNVDEFLTSPSAAPLSSTITPTKHSQYPIPSSALSYHWDTSPASPSTLRAANKLFTSAKPTHLWTRSTFRDTPTSSLPEVAFLGRSNVGKSSLLNAILGAKELARTSSRPGRTKTMNAFLVGGDGIKNSGRGKLVVLDMPGYGKGARAEWGIEVVKYLRARKQLKRAILLLSAHHLTDPSSTPSTSTSTSIKSTNSPPRIKLKATDKQLLSLLRTHGIPHQIILSKIDRVLFPSSNLPSGASFSQNVQKLEAIMHGLQDVVQPPRSEHQKKTKRSTARREGPPALGEIWGCAADGRAGSVGVDGVRVAVMRACGLELGREAARAWALDRFDDDDNGNEVKVEIESEGGLDSQEQESRGTDSRY